MVLLAPMFGSMADFRGMKKKMLAIFMGVGLVFTFSMAIVEQWQLMLMGYIFSYMGFALANLFYDSLLTDVTTPERMNRVSAKGYAMGYIGGSTIPFLAAALLVAFAEQLHMTSAQAIKICVIITCLWWGGFSIPLFKNCKQVHYIERPAGSLMRASMGNLVHTFRDIVKIKPLWMFMIAYFFYIDGVNTIIHMATSYGSTLGLSSVSMMGALMLTQFVAVPCSFAFANLAKRIGTRFTLMLGSAIYLLVTIVGFYMGFSLESATAAALVAGEQGSAAYQAIYEPALHRSQILFWSMAALVGTSQGGMQALSRSHFGTMIPPHRSNEFYGFFDIFGKFAAIIGPFLYALIASLTGRSSLGILSLIVLFGLGIAMLYRCPSDSFDSSYSTLFADEKEPQHS